VINGSDNAVIATVEVGQTPDAITFDSSNGNVYVANEGSSTVSVISGSNDSVIATIRRDEPNAITYDVSNHDIYVTNGGSDTVSVIEGSNNA